jgi:23S rRNA G2445 N2-methylase RlmL
LTRRDCFAFNAKGDAGTSGLIVSNMPYGKRAFAHDNSLHDFFAQWGSHLKRCCHGWNYGFLTADESFCAIAGLRVASTLRFENGGIKVLFVTGRIL